ncbi:MAG: hypothetical protein Q7R76_04650 [Candidatus Woesearchaeota archaeon]|nr:hypothetical protein [Candidatus Woesearchaeota archaeon]
MPRTLIYKGKINDEQTGVVPTRGQGLNHSRPIKLKGGRQLLKKRGMSTGSPVKFKFLDVADQSTKYNYLAELVE